VDIKHESINVQTSGQLIREVGVLKKRLRLSKPVSPRAPDLEAFSSSIKKWYTSDKDPNANIYTIASTVATVQTAAELEFRGNLVPINAKLVV